jgi:hypothetical protein
MGLALSVLLSESPSSSSLPLVQQVFQFILRVLPVKRLFDWPGGRAGFVRICEREKRTFDHGPHRVPRSVRAAVDCSMLPFESCHTHLMKTKGISEDQHITILFCHGGATC